MVSMKDIAKACGVSVATVSKALNDYSDIGKPTRDRVRETAKKMGYFPNSTARALKTKRFYNLSVLFTDDQHSGLTHNFYAAVLESFRQTAQEEGYDLTFSSGTISNRKMTYYEHCMYRGIDGVMIANIDFYDPSVQELIMSDIPVVTLDHAFENRTAVISDNFTGMKELTEYVIRCGHRKIAYMHGADSSVTRARVSGFFKAMEENGLEVPDEYVREAPYRDVQSSSAQTDFLLNLSDPPTCIMYPDDLSCLGGINRIRARGFEVGRDVSITGYDGIFLSEVMDPPFTTIRQDTKTIGRTAAQKLISLIEEPRTSMVEHILVPGKLIRGRSVAVIR